MNGKSGLTYFAAADLEVGIPDLIGSSEYSSFLQNSSSSDIEKIFPDALRRPILRKVQFSTTSRIDELVSYVFDEFKNDYFPGEDVAITLVTLGTPVHYTGVVREKCKFEALRFPDGSLQRAAYARYFVKVNNENGDEALVDDKHIKRGRKVFTKQNLRSFLKNCLQREPWNGAPWLVKEPIARQYRLPMEIPAHLVQGANAVLVSLTTSRLLTEQEQLTRPKPIQPSARQPPGGPVINKVNSRKSKSLTTRDFAHENQQVVHAFLQNLSPLPVQSNSFCSLSHLINSTVIKPSQFRKLKRPRSCMSPSNIRSRISSFRQNGTATHVQT